MSSNNSSSSSNIASWLKESHVYTEESDSEIDKQNVEPCVILISDRKQIHWVRIKFSVKDLVLYLSLLRTQDISSSKV